MRVGLVSTRECTALLGSICFICHYSIFMFVLLCHVMHVSIVYCLARVFCLCRVLSLYYRIVLSLVYCIVTYHNSFVGVLFCVYIFNVICSFIFCNKTVCMYAVILCVRGEGETV